MSRRRGKAVQVNIVSMPKSLAAPPSTATNENSQIDAGLAIKLATLIFVITQGALLVYGYSVLVGSYEQYGIDINELDIGKPALLLYGYVFSLSTIFEASQRFPFGGSLTLIMICLIISAMFVYALANKANAGTRAGVLFSILIPLVFISITPANGITRGIDLVQEELKSFTKGERVENYKTTQIITTKDKQELTGKLILADSRFTFLLTQHSPGDCAAGLIIYKLSNSDNRIMRRTILTPVKTSEQSTQKGCLPNKNHKPNLAN